MILTSKHSPDKTIERFFSEVNNPKITDRFKHVSLITETRSQALSERND